MDEKTIGLARLIIGTIRPLIHEAQATFGAGTGATKKSFVKKWALLILGQANKLNVIKESQATTAESFFSESSPVGQLVDQAIDEMVAIDNEFGLLDKIKSDIGAFFGRIGSLFGGLGGSAQEAPAKPVGSIDDSTGEFIPTDAPAQ